MRYTAMAATARQVMMYDKFLSVNYALASAHLKPVYSPHAVNMIRDEYGKVRRRMGYFNKFPHLFTAKIWGIHYFQGSYLIHSGVNLYQVREGASRLLFAGMKEALSFSFQQDGKIYFLDGANYLVYDGLNCTAVTGKIPCVLVAGNPNGGGTQYQQVNLIQNQWQQKFRGDGSSTRYQLAFDCLDNTPLLVERAKLVNGQVQWETLTVGTHYTVDRVNGTVTFMTAPSAPVFAAEDNIRITAAKDRSEARNKIYHCSLRQRYGINGYDNQLFVTGNAGQPNKVFWSDINDPTYFGDLQFAALGQDNAAIMSICPFNGNLLITKSRNSGETYLCSIFNALLNGLATPQIKVEKVVNGAGCISPYATAALGEPLYLSPLGIQSITYQDFTNQAVETLRGDRISRRLLQEPHLEQAIACVYKSYYLLAINGNVYVLDRLNPQTEINNLTNAFQYNCFFWNHIPATCFLVHDDSLLFGTADGKIMEFYQQEALSQSYNDDGATYEWSWEFPEFVGKRFYSNKAIKYLALRCKAYRRTTVTIDVQLEGLWYPILTDNASFGFLDLNDLDLNLLNLSTDTTPKKAWQKYQLKKMDKFALRVRGNAINQPFGLYSLAVEIQERGKHQ